MKTIIKNIKIITPNSILDNHKIVINNNIIEAILNNNENDPLADKVIDGKNQYLSPGFIDIHNHGNSGFDTMDATFKALSKMADYHLNNGVTSFLAATMTNPNENILKASSNVAEYIKHQNENTSKLLGIYLEGPFFNAIKKGAQPLKDIKNPNIEELKEFITASNNNIIAVSLAPELPNALDMIHFLLVNNIKSAIGHSNATYDEAKKAIDIGSTISTHLYNGMKSFSHREPSIIGACLTHDSLYTELICDGIHLHKTAIDIVKRCKDKSKIVLISDAMRAAGLPNGEYELGGQKVISKDGEARLTDGALAGSTLNLNLAVKNMINLFDTDLLDAINMASINPAKAIGYDKSIGSIEVGKIADLLLIDESVNIKHIIKNGKQIK
ncbi:MAG: N-acetylglucosamine-6-phosphate deacetylase [Bacillota bacterium]